MESIVLHSSKWRESQQLSIPSTLRRIPKLIPVSMPISEVSSDFRLPTNVSILRAMGVILALIYSAIFARQPNA
jgi:hypothetical protein